MSRLVSTPIPPLSPFTSYHHHRRRHTYPSSPKAKHLFRSDPIVDFVYRTAASNLSAIPHEVEHFLTAKWGASVPLYRAVTAIDSDAQVRAILVSVI